MTISRSSNEAEYRVMTHATSEIISLSNLLDTLQVPHTNEAAIYLALIRIFHERIKYIDANCHLIRGHYQLEVITTVHIPTQQ